MSLCRGVARPVLVSIVLQCAGCTRASVASLLPTLDVGITAQHRRSSVTGTEGEHSERRWAAVAFVGLSFRRMTVAGELPLRAELAPETWIAPCDEDDVICLQEAIGAEREIAQALGELQ
jgi:hypothetical protein